MPCFRCPLAIAVALALGAAIRFSVVPAYAHNAQETASGRKLFGADDIVARCAGRSP